MSLLIIGRGECTLGHTERDAAGNIVQKSAAKWEPDPEGASVAICRADPDTMEPVGAAEVFGDWDAAAYLSRVLALLGPGRPINIPDMDAIIKGAIQEGFNPCDYCHRAELCRDCIVTEWKGEIDDE